MSKSAINFRTTYVLMGAAALLLGGLAIYVFFGSTKRTNPEGFLLETFHTLKIKPQDVTGLEIEKGGEKIVFSRQSDGRWRITEPIDARADTNRIDAIVGELLLAKREEKGADVTPNLAVHGLDKPAVRITLRRGDRTAWLALGKTTVGGEQAVVYVLTSDDPKTPQATRAARLRSLFKEKPPEDADTAGMVADLDDFRTRRLLGEGVDLSNSTDLLTAVRVTINPPAGKGAPQVLALSRSNQEKSWRFEAPAGYGSAAADPTQANPAVISSVRELLNTALTIEVPRVQDYLAEPKNLAAVGLDPGSPGVMRVEIERDTERVGGPAKETLWLSLAGVKTERNKVYARYEGDAYVSQVNAEKPDRIRTLVNDPTPLRERTLVKVRRDHVDAVEITANGTTFQLQKGEKGWRAYEGGKAADASKEAVDELLTELTRPNEIKGFPTPDQTEALMGLDKPAAEVKVWEDGLGEPAEANGHRPLKGAPAARVQFGRADVGDLVFARRVAGLTKIDAKVPAALMTTVQGGEQRRGRLYYVDVPLKTFDLIQVEKVTLPYGGMTYTAERDKSGRWAITAPTPGKYADPEKVHAVLEALRHLRGRPAVAEGASAEQLKPLGLAAPEGPKVQVTLKVAGETADRVYAFGNPVGSTPNVYAKTSLNDIVFEAPKGVIDVVTQGTLFDPTLYRIDVADVTGLKLSGWTKIAQPQVLEFKREAGVWTPSGKIAVDGKKLEDFLKAVAAPRAVATVVEKAGARPEFGLDVNKGALRVEIQLRESKPVILTLGGQVTKESKLIYAETSRAPGDVYTLKGDELYPAEEDPAYFFRKE
jgi:hypothetical protein